MKKLLTVMKTLLSHPMAKKQKFNVLCRFLGWQMKKRNYVKKGMLYDWVNGRKLYIYSGKAAATGNLYLGLFEYEEMSFLLHYARSTDVFVDCGANVGVYSVLLGPVCKKGFAIEPSTETYNLLQENTKVNGLENVTLIKAGIGDEDAKVLFTEGNDTTNHVVDEAAEGCECEEVEIRRLDSLFLDAEVSILKIDVEGYEPKVIAGAEKLLASEKLNVIVMETFGNPELEQIIIKKGFKLYSYDPVKRTITEMDANRGGNNGIFIRDIALANERVKTAEKVAIGKKVL